MNNDHTRGYFQKSPIKIQNHMLKASQIKFGYHDQRNVPTYVRRLVEPINGDVIKQDSFLQINGKGETRKSPQVKVAER